MHHSRDRSLGHPDNGGTQIDRWACLLRGLGWSQEGYDDNDREEESLAVHGVTSFFPWPCRGISKWLTVYIVNSIIVLKNGKPSK
jgi:hypothetical protein